MSRPRLLIVASLALVALTIVTPARADTPQGAYQLRGQQAHAGIPFVVDIVVEGLDAEPAPTPPTLTIAGGTATSAGIGRREAPTVIINGQRIDQGGGAWILSYRVEIAKGGPVTLPSVTVTQGSKQAVVRGGRLQVDDVQATNDMAIEVVLPERPVYVGETVPAEITWFLRANPQDQSFTVPLLAMDKIQVMAPPAKNPRQAVKFPAGAQELALGFQQDEIARGGQRYSRFRFPILITPLEVGSLEIPPAQVVARLEVGSGRDSFGFPTARTELFRASDQARRLEVRALPETGKPASFGGAVGSSFSMAVRASRSVVQLGEPVELDITVKGAQRLDALGLPPLDSPGMLPRDTFVAPSDPPIGELSEDGLSKTFKVSVQVVSDKAREIPALAFSYFDADRASYQTIHSDPIALSVKGGSVVGAAQVVGSGKDPKASDDGAATADPGVVSLVGVDLALSSPGAAGNGPLPRSLLWALVAALYLVPLGVLGMRSWRARTAGRREEAGEVKVALRVLRDELERARKCTAKEAAVGLPRALRAAGRALGGTIDEDLIVRIENAGFAPGAGADPLPSELRNEVADAADAWSRGPRNGRGTPVIALVIGLGVLGSPALARADEALVAGRSNYQAALAATDPAIRQRNFAAAAAVFAPEARSRHAAPLYADWGNAALGAGDLGGAALAYRRALTLDATDARARLNLAWLRSRLPDDLRPPPGGATETLFFFHGSWSRDRRLVVGALAFALAILLVVPWGGRRRAWAPVAIIPILVWGAMSASLLIEDQRPDDAVLMRSLVLRVADSAGAPPKRANPLPAGIEVAIVEQRSDWARVRLPSGSTGWVPTSALERVNP